MANLTALSVERPSASKGNINLLVVTHVSEFHINCLTGKHTSGATDVAQ